MYQLKIIFRSFLKHKSSSFINLVGLTLGLSCAFFIFLWVQDEYKKDTFHKNNSQLFQVMAVQDFADKKEVTDDTPGLLGQSIIKDFPGIKYAVTTTNIGNNQLSYEDKIFKEDGLNAGKDFFEIFSFPLLIGNPNTVLNDISSICISKKLAIKFFGSVDNAIGKTINWRQWENFKVTGVFENVGYNSTLQFNFVLPLQDFLNKAPWAKNWANSGLNTYVQLKENVNANSTSKKIAGYLKSKVPNSHNNLFLTKFSNRYLYGKYTNGVQNGGRIEYVQLFSIIAIFILVIACINFMNLSTARATKRAKEVGVRKTIGALRSDLIFYYITEAISIAFVAMILSYVFVILLLPTFNDITGKYIEFSISLNLILISLGVVLFTGILAGSYPAFYLTHFKPVQVLKTGIKSSLGELWTRKGLVIFQFTITIILIVGVVVIHRQIEFANNKNLGYNKDNIILFGQNGTIYQNQETFLNELRNVSGVLSAGGTSHQMLGNETSNYGLNWEGKLSEKRVNFERFFVDHNFYETMQFKMAKGRWFNKSFVADSTKLVINEAAANVMGFNYDNAIGKRIDFGNDLYFEIIGVVKDFHFTSIHQVVSPAYFRLFNTWNIAAKLKSGREKEALLGIQQLYEKFAPGNIFDYKFIDTGYQSFYESEQRIGKISTYFAILAILISCLGLFGLVAFSAERRAKEIGVRKVLGASTSSIIMMLSKEFLNLVFIAILIGLPIAYFFMKQWLSKFAYRIDLSFWIFISVILVSLLIAWLTVSFQAYRFSVINPVKSLKSE
ncbi:MAG: ABC transporter permease [Polaribacter sp.]